MLLSRATLYNARTLRGCPGRGGMPLSACPRPAHRPLGAADRRAPAVHANALALLTLLSASALPADSDARLLAHVGYCNLNAYV